ncbi:MAG: hypothetical protein ABUJ92_07520 [Desulfobacterales bacterium]
MKSGNDVEYYKDSRFGISIVFAYANSDTFYPATLLRHGRNDLCFATEHSIAEGEKIYIMTQDYPLDDANLKIYEGCLAKVHGSKKIKYKKNQAYMIQVRLVNGIAKGITS